MLIFQLNLFYETKMLILYNLISLLKYVILEVAKIGSDETVDITLHNAANLIIYNLHF